MSVSEAEAAPSAAQLGRECEALFPGISGAGVPLEDSDVEQLHVAKAALEARSPRLGRAVTVFAELIQARKYDIRVLSLGLRTLLFAEPLAGAALCLERLTTMLEKQWDSFEPGADDKQKRVVESVLGSLLEEVSTHIAAHTPRARELLDPASPRNAEAWLELPRRLDAALRAKKLGALGGVTRALGDHVRQLVTEAFAAAKRESGTFAVSATPSSGTTTAPAAAAADEAAGFSVSAALGGGEVTLRASARFFELLDKLRAFEALVRREEYAKAALVSADIAAAVEKFDPKLYFPDVFARFSQLSVTCADALLDFEPDLGSPQWSALGQLYRVDLGRFVEEALPAKRTALLRASGTQKNRGYDGE